MDPVDVDRVFEAHKQLGTMIDSSLDFWSSPVVHGKATVKFELTDGREAKIQLDIYPLKDTE